MSGIAIQPVQAPMSMRESVERALSTAIVTGELAPGTLVSVPNLAAQFDVSATPVREAMLELERRGFVDAVRNKGFRVTDVSDEELRNIVEVRLMLEPTAMEQLATRFTKDTLPSLRALALEIVEGAEQGDLRAYLEADVSFHLALTAKLGNPLLVEMVRDLRARTRMVGLTTLMEQRSLTDSAQEHLELLTLLSAGDAAGARALMERHVGHVTGLWSGRPE